MATLTLRPEVVAASLPLTMQDAPERHAPPLAADDAFRVLQQLRAEGRSLREPGLARYGTWISASWHALAWPEPSARLVFLLRERPSALPRKCAAPRTLVAEVFNFMVS